MFYAIEIKYLGPGNKNDSRLKATMHDVSATIKYPHDCTDDQAYTKAAKAVIDKWNNVKGTKLPEREYAKGELKSGNVVFVPVMGTDKF